MDKNIWDNIGRAVTGAADTVGRKATEVAGVAKLKNQIFSLERDMKRDYEAIGKIVYERFAAAGSIDDVPLQQLCEDGRELRTGELTVGVKQTVAALDDAMTAPAFDGAFGPVTCGVAVGRFDRSCADREQTNCHGEHKTEG